MGNANEIKMNIPIEYVQYPFTSVGKESGFIQVFYPGNLPLPASVEKVRADGQWYKSITILFGVLTRYPNYRLEKTLKALREVDYADQEVRQGDLFFYTQSEKKNLYNDDITVEKKDGAVVSIIRCSDSENDPPPVPLCSLYYTDQFFEYKVNFDKKIFSDWREIKKNTHSLVLSFMSKETQ